MVEGVPTRICNFNKNSHILFFMPKALESLRFSVSDEIAALKNSLNPAFETGSFVVFLTLGV